MWKLYVLGAGIVAGLWFLDIPQWVTTGQPNNPPSTVQKADPKTNPTEDSSKKLASVKVFPVTEKSLYEFPAGVFHRCPAGWA